MVSVAAVFPVCSMHLALFSDPDTKPPPRLGELTVTDMTPNSMSFSWTVAEGEFDSFLVQYKDRDGQLQVVPVAGDQRELTIPDLEPGRKYRFLIYGLVGRKRLGPVSTDGATGEPPQLPSPCSASCPQLGHNSRGWAQARGQRTPQLVVWLQTGTSFPPPHWGQTLPYPCWHLVSVPIWPLEARGGK